MTQIIRWENDDEPREFRWLGGRMTIKRQGVVGCSPSCKETDHACAHLVLVDGTRLLTSADYRETMEWLGWEVYP